MGGWVKRTIFITVSNLYGPIKSFTVKENHISSPVPLVHTVDKHPVTYTLIYVVIHVSLKNVVIPKHTEKRWINKFEECLCTYF